MFFPFKCLFGISKSCYTITKKKRHKGGLIKYFTFNWEPNTVRKPNNTAVLQSIAAGHNPWIMLLCETACLFYSSQESFEQKMLSRVFLPDY